MKGMKTKTTKVVLIVIALLEILFVVACFVFPENVTSTLIMYWHITFIAELFACAGIKISKVRHFEMPEEEGDDPDAVG